MEEKIVDFLIVGQGLAGTLLANRLLSEGKTVQIVADTGGCVEHCGRRHQSRDRATDCEILAIRRILFGGKNRLSRPRKRVPYKGVA